MNELQKTLNEIFAKFADKVDALPDNLPKIIKEEILKFTIRNELRIRIIVEKFGKENIASILREFGLKWTFAGKEEAFDEYANGQYQVFISRFGHIEGQNLFETSDTIVYYQTRNITYIRNLEHKAKLLGRTYPMKIYWLKN